VNLLPLNGVSWGVSRYVVWNVSGVSEVCGVSGRRCGRYNNIQRCRMGRRGVCHAPRAGSFHVGEYGIVCGHVVVVSLLGPDEREQRGWIRVAEVKVRNMSLHVS